MAVESKILWKIRTTKQKNKERMMPPIKINKKEGFGSNRKPKCFLFFSLSKYVLWAVESWELPGKQNGRMNVVSGPTLSHEFQGLIVCYKDDVKIPKLTYQVK